MNKSTKLRIFALAMLAIGAVTFSFAQNQREEGQAPGMREHGENMAGMDIQRHGLGMGVLGLMVMHNINAYLMHAEDLELTEQQIQRLRESRTQFMQNTIQARARLQNAMVEICDLLDQEQVDIGQVQNQVREYQSILTDHLMQATQTHVNVRNILTPEQRQQARGHEITGWCAMMGMDENTMRRRGPMRNMPPENGQHRAPRQNP